MIPDILNMSMDSIADVESRQKQEQKKIDQDNHFLVEGHGVTLTVTEDKVEAVRIYRESQDTDKRVIRIWNGKRFQILPRGYF